MKQTVYEYDFRRAFEKLRPDQFSYEGLGALFNYFEEFEEDSGKEIELDVIGICCEYREYKNLKEYKQDYDYCESISQVQELTIVIPIDTESFIIQQY